MDDHAAHAGILNGALDGGILGDKVLQGGKPLDKGLAVIIVGHQVIAVLEAVALAEGSAGLVFLLLDEQLLHLPVMAVILVDSRRGGPSDS